MHTIIEGWSWTEESRNLSTYQRLRQCCFTHTGHSSTNFGFGQKKKLNDTKGIIKSRKYNAMAEWKRTNNALRNTTQKTTDRAIQTPLKTEDELANCFRIPTFQGCRSKHLSVTRQQN